MTHVVVIGGGISGLAAAFELVHHAGGAAPCRTTLVEAGERLGGKIGTEPFAGIDLDTGADSFITRHPAAAQLAREAGLGDDLIAPATGRAWMWTRDRLRALPRGLVLGVPTDLGALARSGAVPAPAVARAALDLVLPGTATGAGEDVAVGDLVRRRMGAGVQLGLVDPLVGGINAGHTDRLSAAVVAPQLLEAARAHHSLIRGLRAATAPAGATTTPFLTVRGGLGRLVEAVSRRLAAAPGTRIVVGDGAAALIRGNGRGNGRGAVPGWRVGLASGRVLDADAVVVACPAAAAANLLGPISGPARALGSIGTASVALTTLAYRQAALARPVAGSGFLVPRGQGRLLTAATWVGSKWPHLAVPGVLVVRASAGRIDDQRAFALDDDELVGALHAELASAMGLRTGPIEARVHRWPGAFPQYRVGHLELIAGIERQLAVDAPGVTMAGASLRGVGLATCIAGGRSAANRARWAGDRRPPGRQPTGSATDGPTGSCQQ